MDVEIYIYGVPNGASFYGKEEDRPYFENFYTQKNSETVKFIIQARPLNGKTYYYYNYLVYRNVIDCDSRPGSYFGLSIRLDEYCKDFISIYRVLDTTFKTQVLNKILKVQNGSYRYIIADFRSSQEAAAITKTVLNLLNLTLTNASFGSLANSNAKPGCPAAMNIYDATDDIVITSIKTHGQFALSPDYQTQKELQLTQQYNTERQSIKKSLEEQYNAIIAAKDTEITNQKSTLSQLQLKCDTLNKAGAEKDEAISKLNSQIVQNKKNQKIAANLNALKEPVLELADVFNGHPKSKDDDKEGGFFALIKGLLPFINLAILVVIVILLIKGSPAKDTGSESLDNTEDVLSDSNQDSSSTNEDIDSNSSNEQQGTDQMSGSNPEDIAGNAFMLEAPSKPARIDVENYTDNTGYEKGLKYNIKIVNETSGTNGKWEIEGGVIKGPKEGNKTSFIPKEDIVTLRYIMPNGKMLKRELKVKS